MEDVRVYDQILKPEFCARVISLFEEEDNKVESARYALSRGTLPSPSIAVPKQVSDARRGTVALCGTGPMWTGVRDQFVSAAQGSIAHFAAENSGISSLCEEEFVLTAPRIEKICEGDGFEWHMDSRHVRDDRRFLTLVFYLNDVNAGGETEFLRTGYTVEPRCGRLLLLPPFWTHLHRGRSPIGAVKYTVSMFASRSD